MSDLLSGSDGLPTHNTSGIIANACGDTAVPKTCCQRYTADWTCSTRVWSGPFAGTIGCVPTGRQLRQWTKITDDGSTCTYAIDIGDGTACTMNGDCDSLVTAPPPLPTATNCGCGVVCFCPDISLVTISGLTGWCAVFNGTYPLNKFTSFGICEWEAFDTATVPSYGDIPPGTVTVNITIRFTENVFGGFDIDVTAHGSAPGEPFAHQWDAETTQCGPFSTPADPVDPSDTRFCGSAPITVTFS